MAPSRTSGLDKILGRIDDLDSVNLTILVQRLVRERRLQETVFNTIRDGIIVIDGAGVVQYANQMGRQMIGIEEKEVGSIRLWKMVPDLAYSINLEELTQREADKAPVISREVEMTYPERRIVRLYMVPMEGGRGSSEAVGDDGYIVVLTDVTEVKLSMEERLEQERTSSIVRLAAGVAHELGNPLNSLTIHLQLIARKLAKLEGIAGVDKLEKSVAVCQGEVERLDGIITHFLEAVRPQKPNLAEINLLGLLDEVMEVQGPELSDRDISVSVEVRSDLPGILGDSNQIKQVFFNVIKNAMEAMGGGGRLRVRARTDDAFVHLQFADSGTGIADEDLSRVFQAYFTTKKTGHGLGMMIVQRIMRDHGGHVSIESRQGVGTVVTLQFPLKHRRTRLLE